MFVLQGDRHKLQETLVITHILVPMYSMGKWCLYRQVQIYYFLMDYYTIKYVLLSLQSKIKYMFM